MRISYFFSSVMKYLFFLLFLLVKLSLFSQPIYDDSTTYCIAFYNVENLFDTEKDSIGNDGAFTPSGSYRWTKGRYIKKVNNIAKVFLAIHGWNPPDIIGLAEVENEKVLKQLCYYSPLKKYDYHYVHYDSPEPRGIDVALLYRADKIKITESFPIPIIFPFEPQSKNRDILYVKALIENDITLHLFVNHWTSRYGGHAATIPKRNYYATVLRQFVDSLLNIDENANIIIMGDFNDYPTDESISEILGAANMAKPGTHQIYNLMYSYLQSNKGTHKNEAFWGCLDQFMVNSNLLAEKGTCYILDNTAYIFDVDFLLIPDEKYGGVKNFRTYLGFRYQGGYSDHLPIYMFVKKRSNK